MSARKSYDIEPKRPKVKRGRRVKRRTKEPEPRRRKSLRAKREEARGRRNTVLLSLVALIFCGVVYGLWQPEVRIATVLAEETPDPQGVARMVEAKLKGSTLFILPRDSFFLYPEREIRAMILEEYPIVSDVELRRTGWTSISISTSMRKSAFLWCGSPEAVFLQDTASCYEADKEGFVFKPYVPSEEALEPLRVYAYLEAASSTESYPLRAMVLGTGELPDVLKFAKTLSSLGIVLRAIAIRGDEADLYTAGGTKIMYVIGKESTAELVAESSFNKLNFMDGSIEYVDLRFGNKAYIQRTE